MTRKNTGLWCPIRTLTVCAGLGLPNLLLAAELLVSEADLAIGCWLLL
jgi:hypothetical protein